ncbi:hypothetical protein BGZ96_009794 [Linnemannia gamsii]|uniref:C3H1-type domain-containing protein n=1 Tax=Linnemannia gamsii TaxID=64522 RepID=A0ABQ7JW63_9FUNG|nr:hypothetical protein BGZ96_009794 [Linnemannia gamsii]
MRYSTTTALVASSLALLACSSFSSNYASAALTPQERLNSEAKDPVNPNYCPDCLKKALVNHFPHACPTDLEPLIAITRPSGPTPTERRCVCIAFLDLHWMKTDCSAECAFVHSNDAMTHLLNSKNIPDCDQYVDIETGTELEMDGFEKKDPNYVPEVFGQATREEAEANAAAQERAHAEAYPSAEEVDVGVAEESEAKKNEKEPLGDIAFELTGENAPKITVKMENFIRDPDGSIPDYALAEMAAEAKAKAEAEATAAAAATTGETEVEVEAGSESNVKDEL